MSRDLEDKVVIVAGAGPGIGRSTALALARDGADVVVA
ncbi:MAG: SDR family NAD(P)-dependent oxidoreductase, partial [Verrucomicrobiota bacterium]|nr:SDR family NAD(P)-dependent oxidoreductase [Verrucomicrobiota bacterium]